MESVTRLVRFNATIWVPPFPAMQRRPTSVTVIEAPPTVNCMPNQPDVLFLAAPGVCPMMKGTEDCASNNGESVVGRKRTKAA